MDLSVIIVSYRGWDRLKKCMESLDGFTLAAFSMEVIVVDNNSNDGMIGDIEEEFGRFRFIRNTINGGFANGCNTGASSASGDIFLFLNPDTVTGESEIGRMIGLIRKYPEYKIISCRQVKENGKECSASGRFPGLKLKNLIGMRDEAQVYFPDWVSGSVMLIRKETYLEMNGFDERFWMYYEDVDLCMRIRKAGGEIAFFNDIVIEHNHGGSSRVNLLTTSVTKCEVQASRHVYIAKHLSGYKKTLLHIITITDNLVTGILSSCAGLVFFFVPKLFVRVLIFARIINYYRGALIRRSWISPRSVISSKPSSK